MTAIDLAHHPDFRIGALTVRPSLREVIGPARAEIVEPRVMQVLIVLAEAAGSVVSRDDLNEQCWGGRVVGDDAVNRVIAKVRRLAERAASGGLRLETIPKVGYRLIATTPKAAADRLTDPVTPSEFRRLALRPFSVVALVALLLALVATVAALRGGHGPSKVAVLPVPVAAPAHDLETRGLSAVFEGTPEQNAVGLAYLRQAAVREPGRATGWGALAMGYVLSLPFTPEAERPGVVARVREAAAHGLALDRHDGLSLAALISLEPVFGHWAHHDEELARALAAAPDTPPLLFQRAMFLAGVGRTHEALAYEERLYASSPMLPWIQAMHIQLLAANGRLDAAERAAGHAGEMFPRDREVWFARFDLAAFNGKPDTARAMLADRANWPRATGPDEMTLAGEALRAIETRAPADIDRVLADDRRWSGRGQGYAERGLRVAAALGRPAQALAIARRLYLAALPPGPRSATMPRNGLIALGERNTVPLFLPPAERLWADPGFLPLMQEIGLTRYWRESVPPDLCRDPSMAAGCAGIGLRPRAAP